MDSDKNFHIPVLAQEIRTYLQVKKGMVIADCTIGGGGHAEDILKGVGEAGYLVGIDMDSEALRRAKPRLEGVTDRFSLFRANYADIDAVLQKAGVTKIDGALFDLGISSLQMDDPERGFSIRSDGPLDMRMNMESGLKASDIVNNYGKEELAAIFKKYGDEHFAFRIAERVVKKRKKQRIERTASLAEIVADALPHHYRFRRIHPATKVFMALRIAVNGELKNLETGLTKTMAFLKTGARICVISFHSIEDRIVKNKFKELAESSSLKIITKKPIRPSAAEAADNPRSRSARLRVGERA